MWNHLGTFQKCCEMSFMNKEQEKIVFFFIIRSENHPRHSLIFIAERTICLQEKKEFALRTPLQYK